MLCVDQVLACGLSKDCRAEKMQKLDVGLTVRSDFDAIGQLIERDKVDCGLLIGPVRESVYSN